MRRELLLPKDECWTAIVDRPILQNKMLNVAGLLVVENCMASYNSSILHMAKLSMI